MPNNKICYAVIALTKTQAIEVIYKLKDEHLDATAEWLEKNKDIIYGDFPEDWRPFKDERIIDMIDDGSIYKSETHLISVLNENCTNNNILHHIKIFFIDMFALHLDKYKNFATRLDARFSDSEKGNCCFLMNPALHFDAQEQLEKIYRQTWPSVSEGYADGSLHRIAVRIDDVKNFKNYLKYLSAGQDIPNHKNYVTIGAKVKSDRPIPQN